MNHQFPEIVTMPFEFVEALIDTQTLKKVSDNHILFSVASQTWQQLQHGMGS